MGVIFVVISKGNEQKHELRFKLVCLLVAVIEWGYIVVISHRRGTGHKRGPDLV